MAVRAKLTLRVTVPEGFPRLLDFLRAEAGKALLGHRHRDAPTLLDPDRSRCGLDLHVAVAVPDLQSFSVDASGALSVVIDPNLVP
jgi:hypothetical protein